MIYLIVPIGELISDSTTRGVEMIVKIGLISEKGVLSLNHSVFESGGSG